MLCGVLTVAAVREPGMLLAIIIKMRRATTTITIWCVLEDTNFYVDEPNYISFVLTTHSRPDSHFS